MTTGSQAAKLGIRPGRRVQLHQPPPGWALADPPPGLSLTGEAGGAADLIIAFFTTAHDLAAQLDGLARRIFPAGALWVAWPRRAGGHHSDITDTFIRSRALAIGLVDVKVAAIDEDWSGLRLVWRVVNRALCRTGGGDRLGVACPAPVVRPAAGAGGAERGPGGDPGWFRGPAGIGSSSARCYLGGLFALGESSPGILPILDPGYCDHERFPGP